MVICLLSNLTEWVLALPLLWLERSPSYGTFILFSFSEYRLPWLMPYLYKIYSIKKKNVITSTIISAILIILNSKCVCVCVYMTRTRYPIKEDLSRMPGPSAMYGLVLLTHIAKKKRKKKKKNDDDYLPKQDCNAKSTMYSYMLSPKKINIKQTK